jgi:DNA (cytosine-5)-methyltransferase 1
MHEIIILDLFSSIGGFAKAFIQAGYKFKKHYFSEVDKYAIINYLHNFKHAQYVGAIEKIDRKSIERPDIITFGFPCQDVSIANKGKGLKGSRSSLFFEAIRIIRYFKPAVFIFENVKGLFSSSKGKDFEIVLKEIADIGFYDCEWQLLNTRWFLPQNRERIFFIGHLRGESRPKVFPFTEDHFPTFKKEARQVAAAIIATKGLRNTDNYIIESPKNYKNARRLTPLECERLQGFPDNWTQFGTIDNQLIEISDRQRYLMIGGAVSVPVVEAIARRLKQSTSRKELSGFSKYKLSDLEAEALELELELLTI